MIGTTERLGIWGSKSEQPLQAVCRVKEKISNYLSSNPSAVSWRIVPLNGDNEQFGAIYILSNFVFIQIKYFFYKNKIKNLRPTENLEIQRFFPFEGMCPSTDGRRVLYYSLQQP